MGITISYQGRMADPGHLDELVRVVQGFALDMKWRTWTMPELIEKGLVKDTGLRGISVAVHPECETLHFHIDDQGQFVNHTYHAFIHHKETHDMLLLAMQSIIGFFPPCLKRPGPELNAFLGVGMLKNMTKTQFGGPHAHAQVCTLLRLVRDRFAPDLEVKDATGYFENGCFDELERQMGEVDQAIRMAQRAMERIGREGGVGDINGLAEKLTRYMNEEQSKLD